MMAAVWALLTWLGLSSCMEAHSNLVLNKFKNSSVSTTVFTCMDHTGKHLKCHLV